MYTIKKIGLLLLFFVMNFSIYAQCAMCKAVVETDIAAGGETAKGINAGIIYLMFIPYILIALVGYFIYRNYHKNKLKHT